MKKQIISSTLFLLLFLSFSLVSIGQQVKVATKDGQFYFGEAKLPSIIQRSINVTMETGKVKLLSKDISYIIAWGEKQDSTKSYKLIYTPYRQYTLFDKEGKKISNDMIWLIEVDKSENITLYKSADDYKINKNGDLLFIMHKNKAGMSGDKCYYMQKILEECPTLISYAQSEYIYPYNIFKTNGIRYFEDCPSLVNMIENKELKDNTIKDVLLLYDKCMEEEK